MNAGYVARLTGFNLFVFDVNKPTCLFRLCFLYIVINGIKTSLLLLYLFMRNEFTIK